jgi:hypothetical protein
LCAPREFQVLALVLTHGHHVSVVQQDVSGRRVGFRVKGLGFRVWG